MAAMADRFDRLTADAQTALSFAQEEALRFNQKYVGTEHILLGLLRQDNGPAAKLLRSLGVDMERLPAAVRSHMERGYRSVYDELPLTPGAEKAIDLAFDEARRLRSKTVGAEHLWVGHVSVDKGVRSGPHHHGALESVIYVISGRARFRYGDRLERVVEAQTGDFVFVPPYLVHQEINTSADEAVAMIVARSSQENVVINVEVEER